MSDCRICDFCGEGIMVCSRIVSFSFSSASSFRIFDFCGEGIIFFIVKLFCPSS